MGWPRRMGHRLFYAGMKQFPMEARNDKDAA